MTDKQEIKKYCSGLDCSICNETEPCIYRIANELQEQLKRKEQECEELKAKIKYMKEYIKTVENARNELEKENNKLKQTLTEIKEITKNMNNECFYDDFDCKDCDMKNGCTYQGKIKILQKIGECGVQND